MTRRRESYSGVCYDGPHEGEHVTSQSQVFYFSVPKEVSYMRRPAENFSYDTFRYRWSHAIRKWVFLP